MTIFENLKEQDWVGDVQLRPYNRKGPIKIERGFRTVTLFELEDFEAMASNPEKHVILVAAPHRNGSLKTDALLPLIEVKGLRVFNHLIIDAETARSVLAASTSQNNEAE